MADGGWRIADGELRMADFGLWMTRDYHFELAEKSCGPAPAEMTREPERVSRSNSAAARAQDFFRPEDTRRSK